MATNTTNLNLIKPAGSERVQISQINQNMDILDEKIGAVGDTSVQSQIMAANGLIDSLKNQIVIPQTFSGDCNSINETCVVYVTDTATNSPGSWNILTTIVYNASNAISQIAVSVLDGTMKTRSKSDAWSKWKTINSSRNNITTIESDTTILSLEPGTYQINLSAASNYIPERYGTLVIEKSAVTYGVATFTSTNGTVYVRHMNGTSGWHSAWRKHSALYFVEVTIPNGTNPGIYDVGSLSSLGIPSSATILSAQCYNANASLCVVTGFAVYQNVVYVYVAQTVQVADGVVRITYMA